MRYGRIPNRILDIEIYETYDEKDGFRQVTIREVLDRVGEDIICSKFETELQENILVLIEFTAWTKYTVFQLIDDGLDQNIIAIPRHPYSFIYRRY